MYTSTAILAVAAGLTSIVSAVPEGCSTNYDGYFALGTPYKAENAPSRVKRDVACPSSDANPTKAIFFKLNNSGLTDETNKIGNIVANEQFQFDPAPGQAGYLANSGFSICANNTLAHGDTAVFYSCNSGQFNNIYATSIAEYCKPIIIPISMCDPTPEELAIQSQLLTSSFTFSGDSASTVATSSTAAPSVASAPASVAASSSETSVPTSSSASVAASTGTGSPVYPGTNGTVSTGSPSSTSTPKAFTGAASSLSVGSALALLAFSFAGFALL